MSDTRDDTDLSGMNFASAKEYILEFITTLKQIEKEIEIENESLLVWKKRISLAEQKGLNDLKSAAENQAMEIETKILNLKKNHEELTHKISIMKAKLPLVSASEKSVDSDLLLAELEMITGQALNSDELKMEKELKKVEADAEVEAALKKLKENQSGEI